MYIDDYACETTKTSSASTDECAEYLNNDEFDAIATIIDNCGDAGEARIKSGRRVRKPKYL